LPIKSQRVFLRHGVYTGWAKLNDTKVVYCVILKAKARFRKILMVLAL